MNRQDNKGKLWSPRRDSRVCSRHFIDGNPTPEHPYPTENLGYDSTSEMKTLYLHKLEKGGDFLMLIQGIKIQSMKLLIVDTDHMNWQLWKHQWNKLFNYLRYLMK